MSKDNIKYWRLKKYEKFSEMNLEKLIEVYFMVKNGEIDLSKEKMTGKKKKVSLKDCIEDPENNNSLVTELGIKRFLIEAKKNVTINSAVERGRTKISFVRTLFSSTTLTTKEVAYLLDETEGTMKYYFRKYGITKFPKEALTTIKSVNGLQKFMERPEPEMVSKPSNETKEEFRARYEDLSYKMFMRIQKESLSTTPDQEILKSMKISMDSLSAAMKLETESKTLLKVEKEREYDFKEKELKAKSPKAPTIIEFGDNIEMQQKIYSLKVKMNEMGMDEEEQEKIIKELM